MIDLESQLKKLVAWQYLNAATFVIVVIILIMLLF